LGSLIKQLELIRKSITSVSVGLKPTKRNKKTRKFFWYFKSLFLVLNLQLDLIRKTITLVTVEMTRPI
tara:strand:- start:235 stop:438 length:204 start_codon:yes stop_codon:yes gene_type:complete